ncbi:MAG: hypothetical protein IKW35_07660 [Paludibacteraceae bacterium]|nr:hypothetical protein [Paludibacteraceae bacterium]
MKLESINFCDFILAKSLNFKGFDTNGGFKGETSLAILTELVCVFVIEESTAVDDNSVVDNFGGIRKTNTLVCIMVKQDRVFILAELNTGGVHDKIVPPPVVLNNPARVTDNREFELLTVATLGRFCKGEGIVSLHREHTRFCVDFLSLYLCHYISYLAEEVLLFAFSC